MEDRPSDRQTHVYKEDNVKSQGTLSIYSEDTHNSSTSCSCHHENFKSITSCTHSINTSHTSLTSNTTTINSITLKSNSPAVYIRSARRNSLSINSGDIVDDNLTILHLSHSETIDTKDVYVMANETSTPNTNAPNLDKGQTITNHTHHQSLAVPKWNTADMESADEEYDSEAHIINDEEIIIKRVLAKFNQQNQQIIRRKLSFVDNFQFLSPKQTNPRSYRHSHKGKKQRKQRHRHSDLTRRKISQGHRELLQEISRRGAMPERPPRIITETPTTKRKHKKRCTRGSRTCHSRTITPFDPISIGFFEPEGSPEIVMDHSDYEETHAKKRETRHQRTLSIQLDDIKSPSTTLSMKTPEPIAIHHKKTLSHGPRLFSTLTSHVKGASSCVPNMEDEDIFAEELSDSEQTPLFAPKLTYSHTLPTIPCNTAAVMRNGEEAKTETEEAQNKENTDVMDSAWNSLGALNEGSEEDKNECMDDDMDDMKAPQRIQSVMKGAIKSKKNKHRRLTSAPVAIEQEGKAVPLHVYRTWNYEEEMSDSMKSNQYPDDSTDEDDDDGEDGAQVIEKVPFGKERVFSTFTKELAITTENAKHLFESLSQICVSLRCTSPSSKTKHELAFDSPLLQDERAISFIKLLGFIANYQRSVYVLSKIDDMCIDNALSACQQQLIEIAKKTATYQVIVSSRLRHGSIPPPPPPIEENKSDKPTRDELEIQSVDIDADRCQLYELIWSATHENNTDRKAKEVILLCYILITTPVKFMKLLEARFFNHDHGRASYSTSTDSNLYSNNPSPTLGSMAQSPTTTMPSLPSMTPTFGNNPSSNVSITFDFERIHSSYGVQKKVIHMMREWMDEYWKEDWSKNTKLLRYMDMFIEKAKKAYQNDIDFDDIERRRGLELMKTVQKMIEKKQDENVAPALLKQHKMEAIEPRQRSATDSKKYMRRKSLKAKNITRPRRKSLHKRKFSLLSSPRLSLGGHNHSLRRHTTHKGIPDDLLKIANQVITHQIALYLFKKYCAINPRECLYQYCVDKRDRDCDDNKAPNIQIYKDTFNDIVKWVQSSILLQPVVAKRARIIKKWIKITDELFNIRCFQGFVAVQCALASNAIYTLKDAWNQNSVLKRKHHTKFKEIKVIMSTSHNFENLRRLQREAHAPLIPYFGLFCKDLIYIQEGFAKRNQDGMINWNKLWKTAALIKDYFEYKSAPYTRIVDEDITMQKWLEIELQRSGKLKSELLDKMSKDVAQKDKGKKSGRHHKSFTLMQ